MPALHYPSDTFDTEITIGSAKNAQKASGAKTGTVYNVPVSEIHVMDGLNIRVTGTKDYDDEMAALRESIRNNGFFPDKPLSVFVQKVDGEDQFVIADGHRRFEAVRGLIADDVEIKTLPVIVKAEGTDTRDILLGLILSNSGKPLNAYETALVVKRLAGLGMEYDEIATKIGRTVKMVRNYLKVASAPEKLRKLIVNGALTLSAALKLMLEFGEKAGDVAEEAAANAAEAGGEGEGEGGTARIRASRDVVRTKKDTKKLDFKFKAGSVYGATDPGVEFARMLLGETALGDLLKKVKGGYRATNTFKVFGSVTHQVAAEDGGDTEASEAEAETETDEASETGEDSGEESETGEEPDTGDL